jgi:phosphohistidine swiveling domain-containing protein
VSSVRLGSGTTVAGGEVEGVLRTANEVAEVFALLQDDALAETIIVTDSPSATAVVPLLAQVRGVICRSGGLTSHLAIVCREFELPCLVAAELPAREEIEGTRARILADGGIEVA